MFKKIILIILFFAAVGLFIISNPLSISRRQEFDTIEPFDKKDRILILAPHPDDEALGAAGVIQKALKKGAALKLCYLTCGDFNELSYLFSKADIAFFAGDFVNIGRQRQKEAIRAMNYLGLHDEELIFLGYPDFGTLEIMLEFWGRPRPFEHPVTWISRVPYKRALSYGAPYTAESILKDLKSVLLDFKPTRIFVSHPADTNQDHRALYLFLRVALWDLEGKIEEAQILPYIVHVIGWPRPKGYRSRLELLPPEKLKRVQWKTLALKPAEVEEKHKVISLYPSQVRCDPAYLYSFARKNELFGDYPEIKLDKNSGDKINWHYLGENNNNQQSRISNLAYALKHNDLFIRFKVRKGLKKHVNITVFLLGYSKNRDFAAMPKIRLDVNKAKLLIRDKAKVISVEGAYFKHAEESALIRVPLSALGNPDYILSCAMGKMRDLSSDEISWRILEIKK